MNRYHFQLVNERGHVSRFLFPSFRAAFPRALVNRANVYFTDQHGVEHPAGPLPGEEYPDVRT